MIVTPFGRPWMLVEDGNIVNDRVKIEFLIHPRNANIYFLFPFPFWVSLWGIGYQSNIRTLENKQNKCTWYINNFFSLPPKEKKKKKTNGPKTSKPNIPT